MISSAWRAIATTHLLEVWRDPRKPFGMATREIDLRLSRQLCYYFFLDPPARREKAVPLELMVAAAKGSTKTAKPGVPDTYCTIFLSQVLWIHKNEFTQTHHAISVSWLAISWRQWYSSFWCTRFAYQTGHGGDPLSQYSEEIFRRKVYHHGGNWNYLWMRGGRGGRKLPTFAVTLHGFVYSNMYLLQFRQDWRILSHQPSCGVYSAFLGGPHRFSTTWLPP